MWLPMASLCSENAPSLLLAPPISPIDSHLPCWSMKMWPSLSPAGTVCTTSGLPHLPDVLFFVCAGVDATANANNAHAHRIPCFIRFLLSFCSGDSSQDGATLRCALPKVHIFRQRFRGFVTEARRPQRAKAVASD